ncbi:MULTISPECIES: formate dehydrogenase subunit delta [Rhodovulum]|uniref:Formate dehydrogenase delta subunit n=2 Tax=Rhodovulum TaxID=34008 RepID=A0A8E2VI25_9RHOB|nr:MULTISPECIES: formate dehydrogenase subunit delta [Rhodovulum]PTW47078.1 formate dehydrogenase delta subunit [Rhodovulum kholense]RAP41560.1 formate dehydrogenase [Rhodovulum viride]
MTPDKLAYMANQIATAFARLPDDEAEAAIAAHIDQFWDPRMRARLLSLAESPNTGLSDRARGAAALIRRPETA